MSKSGKQRQAAYRQRLSSALAALGFHGKTAKSHFLDAVFSADLDDIVTIRGLLKKQGGGRSNSTK